MPKFKITYTGTHNPKQEDVTAGGFAEAGHEGRWIDFTTWNPSEQVVDTVLRVRSHDVDRVELVE